MRNLKIKYFILGAVIAGPILFIFLMSLRGISDKPNQDFVAVESAAKGVQCPDGAILEYDRWGKNGWMAKCKLAHGLFVAAEHGHIVIKSEYSMGKQVGEAQVFDASGKLIKSETK